MNLRARSSARDLLEAEGALKGGWGAARLGGQDLAVIGEREVEGRQLALRARDKNKDLGAIPLDEVVARIRQEGLAPSLRIG